MVLSVLKKLFTGRPAEAGEVQATQAPAASSPVGVPTPLAAAVPAEAGPREPDGEPNLEAFVDYVVRYLVDAPEAVSIKTIPGEKQTTIQVACQKRDVGKIIGKSGKTIAAIRVVVAGAAARLGQKVTVEILD